MQAKPLYVKTIVKSQPTTLRQYIPPRLCTEWSQCWRYMEDPGLGQMSESACTWQNYVSLIFCNDCSQAKHWAIVLERSHQSRAEARCWRRSAWCLLRGWKTLKDVASEVCHDQRDSQGDKVQRPVSAPMAALTAACLPSNILHQVGEGCQGDAKTD